VLLGEDVIDVEHQIRSREFRRRQYSQRWPALRRTSSRVLASMRYCCVRYRRRALACMRLMSSASSR
jgi:hypothetical protein